MNRVEAEKIAKYLGYEWLGRIYMLELLDGEASMKKLKTTTKSFESMMETLENFDILSKSSSIFDILSQSAKSCDNLTRLKKERTKERNLYINNDLININTGLLSEEEEREKEYNKKLDLAAKSVIGYLNSQTKSVFRYEIGGKLTENSMYARNFIVKLLHRGIAGKNWKLTVEDCVHLMQDTVRVLLKRGFPSMRPKTLWGWNKSEDYISDSIAAGWFPPSIQVKKKERGAETLADAPK